MERNELDLRKLSGRRTGGRGGAGFSLVEVVVALFLISLGVLAAAPMFIYASRGNATGADFGTVGALAVERLELLREQDFDSLAAGGDLTANATGYFDEPEPGFLLRWQIADNVSPTSTKTITLRAMATGAMDGPAREVTLITMRGD